MSKILFVKTVRGPDWPFGLNDRNIVVYDVAELVDGEPDYTNGISEQKIHLGTETQSGTNTIGLSDAQVSALTYQQIHDYCVADAQARGYLQVD